MCQTILLEPIYKNFIISVRLKSLFTPYVGFITEPTIPTGANSAGPAETEVVCDMIGVCTAADSVVIAADEVLLAMEDKATYDMDGTDDTPSVPKSRE